ncbi:purine-nucleoside phosphorylase [Actinomyces sp. MRS3W]|uniref:phosphorylase family protein n=1 Tax=Actinomyces sp. MRS3W TaxID=2800796 RepID=UPI0028FD6417|nr:purine-nucleoside phosphorylase [Actinomyces sp. MRS3W]MDU0348208.1 purine-nucleoside phosphorylase [Actinomyces sp. MRS3W]
MSPATSHPQASLGPDGVPQQVLAALAESGGADGPGPALEAAHQIARRTGAAHHDMLVVLGSGAEGALDGWGTPTASLHLSDLPGVTAPIAPGHVDRLDSYERRLPASPARPEDEAEPETAPARSLRVLVAHGRTHLYEGRGPGAVVALARAAAATGVRAAVLVNANGCLRDWEIGDVMTITDHLNLSGASPFAGTVFVDQRELWDPELAAVLSARTQRSGVYAMVRGSEYQTLAESRMLTALGADCVGMSTVLEAIALQQLGVRVAGMSVVSDLSFAATTTDPDEVVRLVAGAHGTLATGIEAVLAAL